MHFLLFIATLGLGVFQASLGYQGIEHHLGEGWAWAAIVAAFLFSSFLPITIGTYFGAVDVMHWDWYIGLMVAAPGLLFALPSMVMMALSVVLPSNSKRHNRDQKAFPSIEKKPDSVSYNAVQSVNYDTNAIDVEKHTAIVSRENQHVYVSENSQKANEILPEGLSIEDKKYPKALKVIEYSAAAAHSWAEVTKIPKIYQARFLDALEAEHTIDTAKLAVELVEAHQEQLRPYANEAANDALAEARTIGAEAEKEFIEVYDLLGRPDDANPILKKIEAKFGQPQRAMEAQLQRERERQVQASRLERRQRERDQAETIQIKKQRLRREQDRKYRQDLGREERTKQPRSRIATDISAVVIFALSISFLLLLSTSFLYR